VNRAPDLNPGLRIGGASQFNFAFAPFRNLSKGVGPVIDQIGITHPVLLIVVSFWQQPELVAAVVEPSGWVGRQVFSFVLRIHEKERVSRENHLHEPSAILRHDFQLYPAVGKLLGAPTLVIRGLDAARRSGLIRLTCCLGKSKVQVQEAGKQNDCERPHHVLTPGYDTP